jgi:hypothetical protein
MRRTGVQPGAREVSAKYRLLVGTVSVGCRVTHPWYALCSGQDRRFQAKASGGKTLPPGVMRVEAGWENRRRIGAAFIERSKLDGAE